MGTTQSDTPSMMQATPQQQHRWLNRMVGEWTYEAQCGAGGEEASAVTGTETVRSLGGLWIVAEGQGESPGGGPATMHILLGYDPSKQQFVGSCAVSMMPHLWVYDSGELDSDGRKLTLYCDGPACDMEGNPTDKPMRSKDVFELVSEDERTLTGYMLGEDGQWQQVMSATYRRVK